MLAFHLKITNDQYDILPYFLMAGNEYFRRSAVCILPSKIIGKECKYNESGNIGC